MSSDSMIMHLHEEDAASWEYRGEGAANVVLAYCGDQNSELVGKVLRLRKAAVGTGAGAGSDSASALPLSADEREVWENWPSLLSASTFAELNHVYARDVLRPLLGDSLVDPGILVNVSPSFVESLNWRIGHQRPAWRTKSGSLEVANGIGFLMSDHTYFPPGPSDSGGGEELGVPTLSVEIKPKCGFLHSSTHIKVENSVKGEVSRFRMHQHLKASQGQIKTISSYDPLDLFSTSRGRILKAVRALFETPQNNLRVFSNGKEVFGVVDKSSSSGDTHPSAFLLEEALNGFMPITVPADGHIPAFQELIADLLFKSDALQKLLAVQKLDYLDIEGVIHIYEECFARNKISGEDSGNNPEQPPSSQGLGLERQSGHSQGKDDDLSKNPTENRSVEDFRKILQDFLISTTAKDCGLMLTLQPVGSAFRSGGLHVVSSGADYFSKISLLDLDLKRLKKISHYFKLDQEIVQYYKSNGIQAS